MLSVDLFGPTTVTTDSATLTSGDLGGAKVRRILVLLALSAGTPIAKDRLADLLWDGAPPKAYVGTLESYVCVLRRNLGLAKGRRSALATTSNGYVLDSDEVVVDVLEFHRLLAAAASSGPAECIRLTEEALGIASAPLLAGDVYVGWADLERSRAQQALVSACSRASGHAVESGNLETAARLARAAIERDGLAEIAAQHLMHALWRSGQSCEALRVYANLRSAMVEDLGLEPSGVSHSIYIEVLRDGAAFRSAPPEEERHELKMLLGLLRRTLESIPGVDLPRGDGSLAEIAVRLLEPA